MNEIITLGQLSDFQQDSVYGVGGGVSPTLKARDYKDAVKIMEEPKVKVIGQMDNSADHTMESANRVYSTAGVETWRDTCGGGGLEPKIVQKVGDRGTEQYSAHDYSNTIPCSPMSDREQLVAEPKIVAMRGRNPENPTDRKTKGMPLEQMLELADEEGISNTITSVYKDNMLMENVLDLYNQNMRDDGVCGTISTNPYSSDKQCGTFGVVEPLALDEQNKCIRKDTVGTLTTDGSSPKHNNRILVKQATEKGYIECEPGGIADLSFPDSENRRARVQDGGRVSPALTCGGIAGLTRLESKYRIRKLTERECWRLMSFTDEEFDKAKYKKNYYQIQGDNKCCVKLKAVTESQKLNATETSVLCTIKDLQSMDRLLTGMKCCTKTESKENLLNASIVIDQLGELEQKKCATSTTKCIEYMGTQCFLMEEKDQRVMAIIELGKEGKANIGKCMKITMESNCPLHKLFIILTLLEQTTELKTCIYTSLKVNISGYITITENCENNIRMTLSSLRMESIKENMSKSALYKQAGNSIVVDVLVALFTEITGAIGTVNDHSGEQIDIFHLLE